MQDGTPAIGTPGPLAPGHVGGALEPQSDATEILAGIATLSSDAIISLDEAQRITLFNRAAEEIFGYAAAEVLGRPLDVLLPERLAERHRTEYLPAFAAGPTAARRLDARRPVYGRRRDGEEFPAEVAVSRCTVGGHVRYTAVLRDVTERQRREEALRASEARYRTLVETAHDGVFVCDAAGTFTLVNPAFAAMCGRTVAELLGTSVSAVVAPEEPCMVPLRHAGTERGGHLQTRHTLLRPDGTRVHVEIGVTPIEGGEAQGIVHDVSAHLRLEEELRERERRYHGIFDSAFQFVGLLSTDGTLLEANRTALDFVGARLEDVVGRPFWDTPWWSHSEPLRRRLRESVTQAAGGAFVRFETEHPNTAGETVTVDFSLKPVRDDEGRVTLLIPEGRDVTEAKRMAALLRESEATFRSAFEHSGIGMALVGLDGRWQRVNRELCRIVGYDEAELLERTFQDVTHPDDLDADLGLARELLAGTRAWYQLEKRYVRKDGRVVWVLLNGTVIRDDTGAPRFFVAQVQDITARRAGEEALVRRTAELARSNAELEQFAYVASHDLQEPLRAVASYSALLAERYGGRLDDRADRWIRYAVDGARQMQALIEDLLTLSRVGTQPVAFAPTPLDEVLTHTVRILEPAIAASGAEVTAGPLPVVHGDAGQLGQLLQNLVANALKFHRPDAPPRVHVSATAAGEEWVVTVQDAGIGIDPRHAERIFALFKRLHAREEYPGTGIGLAIARKIVERHGGRIWVDPAEGGGSAFRFTMPQHAPATPPVGEET